MEYLILMSACISLSELLDIGRPQVAHMEELARQFPDPNSPDACHAFSKQVRIVEGLVFHLYGVVAQLGRKTEDLSEVADMWAKMGLFCNVALEVLRALKGKYEDCGTPELCNLVLDYKLACDKRYKGTLEELSCQKTSTLPSHLFPPVS